jgi:hypothetical protein
MAEAAPGIFSLDGSGIGQGVALLGDTEKVLMMRSPEVLSQPAVRQDLVSIPVTGLGRAAANFPDRIQVVFSQTVVPAEAVTRGDMAGNREGA